MSVPGRMFSVSSYYLEDLLEETGHVIEDGSFNARRETLRTESKASIRITSRGGERREQTVTFERETELSGDYGNYSLSTQRFVRNISSTPNDT